MAKKPARKGATPTPRIRKYVALIGHVVMVAKNGVVLNIHGSDYVFSNMEISYDDFGPRAVARIPLYLALALDIERYGVRVFETVDPPARVPLRPAGQH